MFFEDGLVIIDELGYECVSPDLVICGGLQYVVDVELHPLRSVKFVQGVLFCYLRQEGVAQLTQAQNGIFRAYF